MSHLTQPLLASPSKGKDLRELSYPVLLSRKYDGIRCLITKAGAVARSFDPIPNNFVRNWLETNAPVGLDGELMINGKFNEVSSAILRADGEPDFFYLVFDYCPGDTSVPFTERLRQLREVTKGLDRIQVAEQVLCRTYNEVQSHYKQWVSEGFEGAMIRSPSGPYKCGRSTWNEAILIKMKPFDDRESQIIGFKELMRNLNPADVDNFGNTKRSSAKDGRVPAGVLGSFICRDLETGVEFDCSLSLDEDHDDMNVQRKQFWEERDKLLGRIITYQCQGFILHRPRYPCFKGFRSPIDMGTPTERPVVQTKLAFKGGW